MIDQVDRKTPIVPGDRFGRLRVLDYPQRVEGTRNYRVLVECKCGTVKEIFTSNLTARAQTPTRSCGCLRREAVALVLQAEAEAERRSG